MSDNSRYAHIEGRRDIVFDVNAKSILGKIDAVVFDLDGTLTDSIGQILSCTHTTLNIFLFLSLTIKLL